MDESRKEVGKEVDREIRARRRMQMQLRRITFLNGVLLVIGFCTLIAVLIVGFSIRKESEPETDNREIAVADFALEEAAQEETKTTEAEVVKVPMSESESLLMLKDRLTNGEKIVPILRDLYPDQVVFLESGQYYFEPLNQNIKPNEVNLNNLIFDENGFMYYRVGDDNTGRKIIDVSKFQGEIDWEKVADEGVDGAIIRVGIRGYSEGAIVPDETFEANIRGAADAGLLTGVYFFTEAISEKEAAEEADYVIQALQDKDISLPVYVDVEDVKKANCRTNSLTKEQRTKYLLTFLQKLEDAGYQAGVYGNLKSYIVMLDMEQIQDYSIWMASYSTPYYFPYHYDMLQFSESGSIDGISEKVDLNLYFE